MTQSPPAIVLTRADGFDIGVMEVEDQQDLVRCSGQRFDSCLDTGTIGMMEYDLALLIENQASGPDFGMKARRAELGNRQNDLLREPDEAT